MRLTSVYQASAAALGLLAGFAMTPRAPSPLEHAVTPYAVAVAWAPAPAHPAGGVAADGWDGRIAAPRAASERDARDSEQRARAAEAAARRSAAAAGAVAKTTRRKGETSKPFAPKMDFVTSTFGVPKRECPSRTERPRVS